MKRRLSMKAKEIAVALFALALVFGCGTQPPYGTEITINPSDYSLSVGEEVTVFEFFDILVTNDDIPLNGVEIEIRFTFAPPLPQPEGTFNFIYLLDEDLNRQDSPFITETGANGSYRLGVEIITTTSFFGDLEVSTGNAFASSKIDVTRAF
ncbi:MAG: hypothetical protein JSU92_08055 [Deltaproteobacteria bacterium]|nr:MAG: hypothetical protein JSU92_08055 [Deltaproteobacteria bacterium]